MDNFVIWDVISYAWTEIGLQKNEYPDYAEKIREHHKDWKTVNKIIIRDVCASFAFDTFLILPCMLWMIMPDWGYDEEYIRNRMNKWYSRPYLLHFLNPMRVLGYPIALLFSLSVRTKLKNAFIKPNKITEPSSGVNT